MKELLEEIIKEASKKNIDTPEKLQKIKNRLAKKHGKHSVSNYELNKFYNASDLPREDHLKKLFQKRQVRSMSGVSIITVLTKPYPCPGKCVFCPTEKGMPKSYLSNEPAAMRALLNNFDPGKQIEKRLTSLKNQGHPTDKIELIVLGGTFSFYPRRYQQAFVRQCFNALNGGKKELSLEKAQKNNENAEHRVVGLSLETRPDHVTKDEVRWLRKLGCTKIQLGVQHLDNTILDYVKRGHYKEDAAQAIRLCKDAGLKICLHMMPNLPGSTPAKDLQMFKELFANPDFRPDYLKVYPCTVTPFSELEGWVKKKTYKSYSDQELEELLVKIKRTIPEYVRIERLIRDIPGESIIEGSKITNMRQEIERKYKVECKCIRCREIKDTDIIAEKLKFHKLEYDASGGKEFFLSYDQGRSLCSMLRLRFPSPDQVVKEIDGQIAIIREVHTYGSQLRISKKSTGEAQHIGLGRKLIAEAENLSKTAGYKKIAVISSVGTRAYYKKLGYERDGTYMSKPL
ncbi:tRNA uridine(34) 5-carboxymethylaminomethyl modification radical SAM/GNAT enzyme Elp3 [Candidatus Peregrinibacteria bacterium CG22_combo_CG10-13_8_21_14_all_44_10]|nr:MAG: hypothetical protein AUK45_03845 [Candidatus Peregrinibacteria bacterium CG2_30_44_17]PIP66139.1 MAG: tRNA uridine(34) 5-carboxymethylaminomethyl modification radical SAM/GNAT enzyme Elp3 [Candidatus Peregrinibacteria bacterium CG22_combo_CG10-13_8_21_14_all_44_10]PIS04205.1 MAG: tRNA uridine(34) 5-carboxymethylaminomethyl modification radical SAM/GNAT enzyme Elp3 [Candidatus Peregrinibacteria bacterium CG10_big_fil_rev_8_21_14_0_10_44_7]PIX79784.1 MAG: tRNA uridine(34) 5-carboxymethylam